MPTLFKDQLKRARKKLSQAQAAKLLRVPVGTYYGWEQGRHKPDKMLRQILVRKLREG